MGYTTMFIDLDDTLYPSQNGLWKAIRNRMTRYMLERMDLPLDQVEHLRHHYYTHYGTTLRGLQIHHNVDPQDYLSFVHDLPLGDYLKPDPELRKLLLSLPQVRWVFTNADRGHALRVLDHLDIRDCFDGIIDVTAMRYHCKPETVVYQYAMQLAGVGNPNECVYLDDSIRNLEPAVQLGFFTIMVSNDETNAIADRTVHNILELPNAVPELWHNSY